VALEQAARSPRSANSPSEAHVREADFGGPYTFVVADVLLPSSVSGDLTADVVVNYEPIANAVTWTEKRHHATGSILAPGQGDAGRGVSGDESAAADRARAGCRVSDSGGGEVLVRPRIVVPIGRHKRPTRMTEPAGSGGTGRWPPPPRLPPQPENGRPTSSGRCRTDNRSSNTQGFALRPFRDSRFAIPISRFP